MSRTKKRKKELVALGLCWSMFMLGGDLYAQEQQGSTKGTRQPAPPIEFSNNDTNGDLNAPLPPGGGPLGIDPEQVLYTEVPDFAGLPFPHDSRDFGLNYQVDALAYIEDAYFSAAHLAISFEGDDAPWGNAVFVEDCIGIPSLLWTQRDLYAENADPPLGEPINDVDALEVWGPHSDGSDPLTGWDANLFSLEGDPVAHGASVPTSVYYHNGSTVVPFITRADIFAAVTSLGFTGSEADVDLDGLMADTGASWSNGGRIIFSIRAAANWDGGEIVRYTKGGGVDFLPHGGHLWDTAFDVAGTFHLDTDDVDGIEGVPCPGWPGAEPPLPPTWNNVDVTNMTGQIAYDVHVVLNGVHKILDHLNLDGTFPNFEVTPDPGNNTTHLKWSTPAPGGLASGAETGICWCTWGSVVVKEMYWTDITGNPIPGGVVCLTKPQIGRPPPETIPSEGPERIDIITPNPFSEPIRILTPSYALFDARIEMADLGAHNPYLMDALVPLGESFYIPPGEEVTVPIPVPVPHGKWVVVVYDVADEDYVVHATEYAETIAMGAIARIPTVSEWGLIVMALLVLTAGTVVFGRRRVGLT